MDKSGTIGIRRYFFRKPLIILLIGVVIGGVLLFRKTNGKNIETVTVDRQMVVEEVFASGQVKARGSANIYTSSTGIITDMYVEDGITVEEGQELFSIKSTAAKQEQQTSYAAYLAAKKNLEKEIAMSDLLRSNMYNAWKEFYDLATNDTYEDDDGNPKEPEREAVEFTTSKYDWLSAEKNFTSQKTAEGAAKANASALWEIYKATQDSVTTAPSSGVVTNIDYSVGDRVTALPSLLANSVLSITNFESYFIDVEIKELDIPKLEIGQSAKIKLDALPDQDFLGAVSKINLLGKNNAGVINYTVRIRLLDSNPKIRHMMSANVNIIVDQKPNTIAVPPGTLQDKNGEKGVEVLAGNKIQWRPVIIGTRGNKWVEIIKGVSEGDEVIIPTLQ